LGVRTRGDPLPLRAAGSIRRARHVVELVEKTLVAEGGGTMGMATVTRIGTQTDQDIQRDVLNELKWEPRVQPNEIGVAVKDGGGTPTGRGESYTTKWAGEGAAPPGAGLLA